ncbi:hypothetical protein DS2_06666 [Catenovulum agarivorans DS-2]|uniref:Lipoprotein n=1 Tax=Catenovulum agarivorans DS-2 TaxID=1328313 RepID=W7QP20_9ALTE|nr:hypothetical protein [Catenovulum agarivorans]EWH10712.1 hypothetical protein DS2_06666 [Catenovulum agarivorans DS-2]
MKYAALIFAITSGFAFAQTPIDVQIKGFDDGVKTTMQTDYKEAVLFAKREAIERSGVKVKSLTTVKDFVLQSDYIESTAEAVLLPGYTILDIGYQIDGSYLVVLTGQVAQPDQQSPINSALKQLEQNHQKYEFELGALLGTHKITKAYFANSNKFVIHYAFKNGVITLSDLDQGLMVLQGEYKTDADSGTVTLDFNQDGSAKGKWRNFLASGDIQIKLKSY